MSWNKFSEKKPLKNDKYLTVTVSKYGNDIHKFYAVHSWANNLMKETHSYDFEGMEEYNHGGFYGHDSEWGDYEVTDITAWKEIEDYEI